MRAAIDIGSNSILLLVVDEAGKVVHDEARVVGLGKGLGERGVFRPERMEAALACLKDYANIAKGAQIRAVATSASRRALNAATFYANVQKQTGIKVEVVSGEEEARLTWIGALDGLDVPPGPVLVCDPGGGSTEVILGEGRQVHSRVSLEIGTVRLTEQFLGYGQVDAASLARLRAHVDAEVAKLVLPVQPRLAVAVAGTATTLAAAELGLAAYDPARVHGSTLTDGALRGWIDRLLAASPERRRELVAVSPERADTVLAGAVILLRVLDVAKRHAFRVSDRGLRYGVLRR
ncbi:MAG: Ppx/GppA family phosphatase [Myxococcota bacterium]